MCYVRAGLPIQELAFLGRWKSNVVLSYAEEALQEKAVELPSVKESPDKTTVGNLKEPALTHLDQQDMLPARQHLP